MLMERSGKLPLFEHQIVLFLLLFFLCFDIMYSIKYSRVWEILVHWRGTSRYQSLIIS